MGAASRPCRRCTLRGRCGTWRHPSASDLRFAWQAWHSATSTLVFSWQEQNLLATVLTTVERPALLFAASLGRPAFMHKSLAHATLAHTHTHLFYTELLHVHTGTQAHNSSTYNFVTYHLSDTRATWSHALFYTQTATFCQAHLSHIKI